MAVTAKKIKTPEQRVGAMSKDQRSLLLYLEARAVDHGGMVKGDHMNARDFDIAEKWAEEKFLRFSRIPSKLLPQAYGCAHVVELTPAAWECAAVERRRRAERSQNKDIVQPSLEHFESLR